LRHSRTKKEALLKYKVSESCTPFKIPFLRNKSLTLRRIADGEYKSAIRECDYVLSLNNRFVYAYFNKVIALFCQDKINEGVEIFSSAYAQLPKTYPKVRKIVKTYKRRLRKVKEQLTETEDLDDISLINTEIKAIERLLKLFDEHTAEKARLYTVYIPNFLIAIIAFFTIGILLLLFFQSNNL